MDTPKLSSEVSFYSNTIGAKCTADRTWRLLLREILVNGHLSKPRDLETKEILGMQTIINMKFPVITNAARKMGYRFLAAEAAWILSGDNRVSSISPYSKQISRFSDDGITFFGAYGPKVIDQISYVVDCLVKDLSSRQAVISIWREKPGPTKDVPCTLSHQFVIRGGYLHLLTTMRSSDAWLGWVYDTFNGSMTAAAVALMLRERGVKVELGNMYLTMGSSHIYQPQWEMAAKIAEDSINIEGFMYEGLDLSDFDSKDDLVDQLWRVAKNDDQLPNGGLLNAVWNKRGSLNDRA